jgi:elongation factor P
MDFDKRIKKDSTVMISSNDFRPGVTIALNNGLWTIVEAMHVKPGKGSAFVRTTMKNVETGKSLEQTFRAGEKVATANIEKSEYNYSYKEGDKYVMMHTTTFEQLEITPEQIGSSHEFLKEGQDNINVLVYENRVIGVELPNTVELEVKEAAPDERGDTSSGGGKPAVLETGASITVTFHIKVGDKIRVDTRSRKYLTRV